MLVKTPTRPDLDALLKASKKAIDAMSGQELEELRRKQCESWVRGEMAWMRDKK
jgi:hypothetical protein